VKKNDKGERAVILKRLQGTVRKYVPESVSLVDELIEDRCWEAAKEEQESHGYGSMEYWLKVIKGRRGMNAHPR